LSWIFYRSTTQFGLPNGVTWEVFRADLADGMDRFRHDRAPVEALSGFVAGSALLTEGLSVNERTRLQGITDALIWSSAAAAALGSGVVVAVASYTTLGLLGAVLILLPVWAMLRGRRELRRTRPVEISAPEVPLD